MILSDFLSRLKHDTSDLHEIIPTSLSMEEELHARYYSTHGNKKEIYLAQARSQNKTSATVLPEAHGIDKGVEPNLRPQKQVIIKLVSRAVQ